MSIEKLRSLVKESNNIVFFGGAGTSTESNIPDFRSETGLYKTKTNKAYPPEYMLSHTCFVNHREDFYDFYISKMIYKEARPNPAHFALAELEKKGKLKAIITPNIDGIHQMAGSTNVLELHGSVHRNYCLKCGEKYSLDYILDNTPIPLCSKCGGVIRPDVVLYEEGLDSKILERAIEYIEEADILIVGGTSLRVYPAAGLINYYKGNKLILINKSETDFDNKAFLNFNESIGLILSKIIQ